MHPAMCWVSRVSIAVTNRCSFFSSMEDEQLRLLDFLLEEIPSISDWEEISIASDFSLPDLDSSSEEERDSEPESGSAANTETEPGTPEPEPEPEPDSTSSESRSRQDDQDDEYSDQAWGIVPQPYPAADYPAPFRAVSDGIEWWPIVPRPEIIWRPLEDQVAMGPTWFFRRGTDPQAQANEYSKSSGSREWMEWIIVILLKCKMSMCRVVSI